MPNAVLETSSSARFLIGTLVLIHRRTRPGRRRNMKHTWHVERGVTCDLNATYWYRVMVAYKLNNPMIVLVDGREDELNDIDGQRGRREARRNDSVIAK